MINLARLKQFLAAGEALDREFKSDKRREFPDRDIFEEIVALANTKGGTLLIGVEDDGTVTGARSRHDDSTNPLRLQSAIFNNTVPSINTRVSVVPHPDGQVIAIETDRYPEPCATASGKSLRRVIGADGKPATVPFYPRDQRSVRIDLGLLDFSAQPIEQASFQDLDPLQFVRLRRTIERLGGDKTVLHAADQELAKALKLVKTSGRKLLPTVAGLLLLGKPAPLAELIPTHAVHFQVLGPSGSVEVNQALRAPLLETIEQVEERFQARNSETEIQVGMFRLPVPDYALEGFREAVNNAILHRDYTRLDHVYVQWHPDHILMTNPGGFPEGVTLDNLLVHEPKPRNILLAEAFKRIGLIEQTGRGIDKIYYGQLRYGRPIPDYTRSDDKNVRVVLRGGEGSLQFAAFVYEEDRHGKSLTLDELIILNALFFERRIDSVTAGKLIQKGHGEARSVLERLQERGLVEARGEKRGRVYHLSARLYRRMNQPEGYLRVHGIEAIRHEEMVLAFVRKEGKIVRGQVADLCTLTNDQATRLLKRMVEKQWLAAKGSPPRWVFYVTGPKAPA
jgi:ATP-dependent DNA helicase RecG